MDNTRVQRLEAIRAQAEQQLAQHGLPVVVRNFWLGFCQELHDALEEPQPLPEDNIVLMDIRDIALREATTRAYSMVFRAERSLGRPILHTDFMYKRLGVPNLPGLPPPGEMNANLGPDGRYPLVVGEHTARVLPTFHPSHLTNMNRAILNGAEIVEMHNAMEVFLDGLAVHLDLQPELVRYLREEIRYYDPRRQLSKSRPHRAIKEFRKQSPVFFHHILSLWVITFGVLPNEVFKQIKDFKSCFLMYDVPFNPELKTSEDRPEIRDTPVDPKGVEHRTCPLKKPQADSLAMQMVATVKYYKATGHLPGKNVAAWQLDLKDMEDRLLELEVENAANVARLSIVGFDHEFQQSVFQQQNQLHAHINALPLVDQRRYQLKKHIIITMMGGFIVLLIALFWQETKNGIIDAISFVRMAVQHIRPFIVDIIGTSDIGGAVRSAMVSPWWAACWLVSSIWECLVTIGVTIGDFADGWRQPVREPNFARRMLNPVLGPQQQPQRVWRW